MADADETDNEILAEAKRIAAAREAGERAEAERSAKARAGKWPVVPIAAAGIGSAALAAALLWSRRDKTERSDKGGRKPD